MSDFGRYLQSVAERDIDLLLMEEFHVTPSFATWFASLADVSPSASFDGAWHSLNDEDGETDLLLRVRCGGSRVAILIENKVGAPPQDEQDIRYHVRGQRSLEAGRYDRFVTALCAPQVYLDGTPATTAYEKLIPYEAIRDWFAEFTDARSCWRRAIMDEAIEQGRRGYTMKVHAGRTAFHFAYWTLLQERYPEFIMAKPGPKGPKSSWMRFKETSFPRGVTLNHKNDQGCMDLEFAGKTAGELLARRSPEWPEGAQIRPTKKSAVVRFPVPVCNMDRPLAQQIDAVETALASARLLVPLARLFS